MDCLSPEEMDNYQDMLTAVKNEIRSAHQYDISQAEARGRAEERAIIAKAMKDLEIPSEKISKASGLSLEEIEAL